MWLEIKKALTKVSTASNRQANISPANDEFVLPSGLRNIRSRGVSYSSWGLHGKAPFTHVTHYSTVTANHTWIVQVRHYCHHYNWSYDTCLRSVHVVCCSAPERTVVRPTTPPTTDSSWWHAHRPAAAYPMTSTLNPHVIRHITNRQCDNNMATHIYLPLGHAHPPPLNCQKSRMWQKNATLDKLPQWKITRTVATRCQILRLKCNKFYFGWGSTPDPAGGA